jgi:hypothetical protein
MSETPTPAPVPGYDRGEAGDKLAAAIERGARARALLENELFRDAFKTLEDDYTAAWKTWPAADTAGRERLWQAVNVLGKVRDHLARVVADGKLAQRELSDMVHGAR